MYEMLAGKSPFMNHNRGQMEHDIQQAEPVFDANFSEDAKDLITKLIKKEVRNEAEAARGATGSGRARVPRDQDASLLHPWEMELDGCGVENPDAAAGAGRAGGLIDFIRKKKASI